MSNKKTIFALTFLSYAVIHSIRTSWAYVKPYLQRQPISFDKRFLGILDMVCHLSLAVNLKAFGWIGDRIGYKLFLLIGMVTLTLTYLCLSLFLLFDIRNAVIYITIFGLVGLFSCTGWPSCLSMMAIYYPAKENGFLLSLWNGCSQFGDFIALFTGYLVIHRMKYPEQGMLIVMSIMMIGMIIINWLFLNPRQQPQSTTPKDPSMTQSKISKISSIEDQLDKQDQELEIIQKIQTNLHLFHSTQRSVVKVQSLEKIEEERTINFMNVWLLPSVASYVLCFGCMKSVNSILLNWLVAYLYQIGLKSYLSSLTMAWCISSFFGSLMMGYFNRTVHRMGLVIPLLVCCVLFIMLANQAKQIGIYVYFVTITIAGLCFGGPYGLVGSKVALSLANDPQIKSMKGAMGIIISLMEGFGQLAASLSLIIVPLIGLNYYFYIPFVLCSLSASILFYQHLKQQQKNSKAQLDRREWELREQQKSKVQSTCST